MIRINLLPQKGARATVSAPGQGWLAIVLGLVVVEVIIALVLYGFKQEELDEWAQKNQAVERQIQLSKEQVKNHAEVQKKLERLRAREAAIEKLQSARTGPTAVLLEISRLLTPGRGPTVTPERLSQVANENPLAMFNSNWDPRRLWLTDFVENSRTVLLKGLARDGEDVSELARRMNLSSYFYDVRLLPAKRGRSSASGFDWVSFQLEARVRY